MDCHYHACSYEGNLVSVDISLLKQHPNSVLAKLVDQDPSLVFLDKFLTKYFDTKALKNLNDFLLYGVWFEELVIQGVDNPYIFLGFDNFDNFYDYGFNKHIFRFKTGVLSK